MTLAKDGMKRCPGWHFEGHRGQEAHTLPATLEFFYVQNDSKDGLNNRCKGCAKGYVKYRLQIENAQREERRARNVAMWERSEHAAGDVAGGGGVMSPGPGNSSAASGVKA